MTISLDNIGKRYQSNWIFKYISFDFIQNSRTGIIGSNGSGKSTLLKIISAAEIPTKGELSYLDDNQKKIDLNEAYKHISFCAPYMDLPEQLTAHELIVFHSKFKPFINQLSAEELLKLTFLEDSKDKIVKNFSSGMKQRLKLGLAICTLSNVLLMDEPCSNLDKKGVEMYQELVQTYSKDRIIIIASNEQEDELVNIEKKINIADFKSTK